jgi:hypothetical protein
MGKKRPEKGGRRGGGKRTSPPRDPRRTDAVPNRAGGSPAVSGPSRLRLTRLVREGAIWDVYIATAPQSGGPNVTLLEFEGPGTTRTKLRCTRPVEGPLLDALHNGAPVSRTPLEEELDHALREVGAVPAESFGPEEDGPLPGQ